MLTLENLKEMKAGVFASGENEEFKWVAVRGGIHDWALYKGSKMWSFDRIAKFGNKIRSAYLIKEIIPCDDEAFNMYRL